MTTLEGHVVLGQLRGQTDDMLADLEALVAIESPSDDLAAAAACAAHTAALGERLLGAAPERLESDGRVHLRWTFGKPRVLLLGHLDTVWPIGTVARWPFAVDGDHATGPGAFDMKAGIVQGFRALTCLDDLDGVTVLLTSDEEIGSPSSRELIEDTARGLAATLVLEPSVDGALKTGRKGVSAYRIEVEGRASHAGLEPEKGINALVELAQQITEVAALSDVSLGTTVTPAVAAAGTATNVVPARAWFSVDARAGTAEEQQRVDDAIRSLVPHLDGARLVVDGGINRPALSEDASAEMFARATKLAAALELPALEGRSVGGGSDGNFTAGLGVPTLDGLGAVGDGAHAEGEYVVIPAMAERAALVAALVTDVLAGPAHVRL